MIIITISEYPLEHADLGADLYVKINSENPLPDVYTKRENYIMPKLGTGVLGIEILECADKDLATLAKAVHKQASMFRKIPGFTYSLNLPLGVEEAMALIGKG